MKKMKIIFNIYLKNIEDIIYRKKNEKFMNIFQLKVLPMIEGLLLDLLLLIIRFRFRFRFRFLRSIWCFRSRLFL